MRHSLISKLSLNLRRLARRAQAWLGRPRIVRQDRIIALDDHDYCEDPIFIIGLHRSGTSLLRRVINSHRNLACPPETFFIKHYVNMLGDQLVQDGYSGFGNDRDMMRRDLARKAASLHEAYRIAAAKQRWADKTPQYTDILPGLLDLFGEKASFIMIYRHPFDVIASLKQRRWDIAGVGSYSFSATLAHVHAQYRKQLDFEKNNVRQCTRIHYEGLSSDPTGTLPNLMQALGEEFDPAQLAHQDHDHGFGTEDPVARGLGGFQPSIGNWLAWDAHTYEASKKALGDICAELGYSINRNDPIFNGKQRAD